jgi:hypothetical protein
MTTAPTNDGGLLDQWLLPLIEHAVEFERTGRHIAAAAALAKVRERYAALSSADLAADEQSWPDFARKRVPLPAARIDELIGKMIHLGGLLRCTECGAGSLCACGCGVPYVGEHCTWAAPIAKVATALERATAAITANPGRSNRAIAKEIGVVEQTVRRARQKLNAAGQA